MTWYSREVFSERYITIACYTYKLCFITENKDSPLLTILKCLLRHICSALNLATITSINTNFSSCFIFHHADNEKRVPTIWLKACFRITLTERQTKFTYFSPLISSYDLDYNVKIIFFMCCKTNQERIAPKVKLTTRCTLESIFYYETEWHLLQ